MVLNKILRAGEGKMQKRLRNVAAHITGMEDEFADLTDAELQAKTEEFRDRYADGESLDDLLPEAFATAREAAHRVLGQQPFEVQLMGGAALHMGQVAEMKTGEGKTLTSVLPAYLNALSGEGVHVVTTNDYLARRDAEWMGRVHRFLGMSVGAILAEMRPDERREAYHADITYGTNNEFGFDYLRDNMAWSLDDCVQRGHNFAIVDEVDSILIDEARTPLIISGPADQSSRWYAEFARLAPRMTGVDTTKPAGTPEEKRERELELANAHYEFDIKKRTVGVTDLGVSFVEDQLGIDNLYESANTPLIGYLNNALKAQELYTREKDYIVRNNEVLIVDEFTGRVLVGRRYNEGMHQAIEAKEQKSNDKVEIKAENQTLATVTLQNYFRLYDKLSGMTGTAQTEAAEFSQTYKLGVVSIPTNRPMVRADQADLIYKTEQSKFDAVAEDIAERHQRGQPVLVGTTSVERSEYLSKLLTKLQVKHEVLNAKHHDREAGIIALAGTPSAVTVSTNMAGRGTDIVLGGNPDHLADQELRDRGLDPVATPEEYEAAWPKALERVTRGAEEAAEHVREQGGLYVLGTERHEARRIDNQLRGRSGRQGDPGESRFYLSLGDELMRRFNASMVEVVMTRLRVPEDVPIEHKMVSKAIKSAQTQVEQQNAEIRKNVLKYDEVMNQQRKVIYTERRRVLEGEDLHDQVQHMLTDVITDYVHGATSEGYAEDWDLDKLWTALKTLYPVSLRWQELAGEDDDAEPLDDLNSETLREVLLEDAREAYRRREAEIDGKVGAGAMRELERRVLLSVLDRKWREHLYEMDYLKEGIGLRALAQRDPLMEYRREGYDMFNGMLDALKEESVGFLFNLQVEAAEQEPATAAPELPEEKTTVLTPIGADPAGDRQGNGQRGGGNGEAPTQQLPAIRTGSRHALPDEESETPAALRGRGLERSGGGRLTYSGPAEDGGVASRADDNRGDGSGDGDGGGGTRRQRREAQRAAAKQQKKRSRR